MQNELQAGRTGGVKKNGGGGGGGARAHTPFLPSSTLRPPPALRQMRP